MATGPINEIIQHLHKTVLLQETAGLTDGQLLESYIRRRDVAALEVIVRRHSPMVWGVCRRLLPSHHDAEDAFQATFLVLVRKAAAIAARDLLANWLYGVAHQTARKARATAVRRRVRERQVTEMPEPAVAEHHLGPDLQSLLDEELRRLPDRYRVAIVLCDLEGKTRKEAARQLGLPEGTVASRLARARTMLAKRLARRGLAFSGGSLAALLAQSAATACVPAAALSATVNAVTMVGPAVAAGVVPARVVVLTRGVLRVMLLNKLKTVTAVLVLLGLVALGGGLLAHRRTAAAQPSGTGPTTPAVSDASTPPARKGTRQPKTAEGKGEWLARLVDLDMGEFLRRLLLAKGAGGGKLAGKASTDTLMRKMDGFRQELPPPQGLTEMNGVGFADVDGEVHPDTHLGGIASRLKVKTRAECLILLTYLKDRKVKIRHIAAFALEGVLNAYPNGFPAGSLDQLDSPQHRDMVKAFVAGIEKLAAD